MSRLARAAALAALVLGCGVTSGCYSIGYEADPALGQTIAVPVFVNETLRRHLEHDMTRHLRREVLETTSLHLAPSGPDVPVLRGTIRGVDERVLIAGASEEVLYGDLRIHVSFGVYRGKRLVLGLDSDGDGEPDQEFSLTGLAERDTARGEDRASAADEALRDVAELIALRLQGRYDDRFEPNQDRSAAPRLEASQQVRLIQRDDDWFRVEVPARKSLRISLFRGLAHEDEDVGTLALSAWSESGAPLPASRVRRRDEGRILEIVAGSTPLKASLLVAGPNRGERYRLTVIELADDPYEPNQDALSATPLRVGAELALLSYDEDWLAIDVPADRAIEVVFAAESASKLRPVLCDKEGLEAGLPGFDGSAERRVARISATPAARKIYLRIRGSGEGKVYQVRIR